MHNDERAGVLARRHGEPYDNLRSWQWGAGWKREDRRLDRAKGKAAQLAGEPFSYEHSEAWQRGWLWRGCPHCGRRRYKLYSAREIGHLPGCMECMLRRIGIGLLESLEVAKSRGIRRADALAIRAGMSTGYVDFRLGGVDYTAYAKLVSRAAFLAALDTLEAERSQPPG